MAFWARLRALLLRRLDGRLEDAGASFPSARCWGARGQPLCTIYSTTPRANESTYSPARGIQVREGRGQGGGARVAPELGADAARFPPAPRPVAIGVL